ncbi:protein of unknown function [Lactiplantibacillus plantarum]
MWIITVQVNDSGMIKVLIKKLEMG